MDEAYDQLIEKDQEIEHLKAQLKAALGQEKKTTATSNDGKQQDPASPRFEKQQQQDPVSPRFEKQQQQQQQQQQNDRRSPPTVSFQNAFEKRTPRNRMVAKENAAEFLNTRSAVKKEPHESSSPPFSSLPRKLNSMPKHLTRVLLKELGEVKEEEEQESDEEETEED